MFRRASKLLLPATTGLSQIATRGGLIKATTVTPVITSQSRFYSSNYRNSLSDKIIHAIFAKKPGALYSLLTEEESENIPDGSFGPKGSYNIKTMRDIALHVGSTDSSKSPEEQFDHLIDPSNPFSTSKEAIIARAFNAMAKESDASESLEKLVTAEIRFPCEALPAITKIIQCNEISNELIKIIRIKCALSKRLDLMSQIDEALDATRLSNAMKAFRACDPFQNKKEFYELYNIILDEEMNFRDGLEARSVKVFAKNYAIDPSIIDPTLRFYVKHPDALSAIDKATIAINSKDPKVLLRSLEKLTPSALAEFMLCPVTTNGQSLAATIISSGSAGSLQVFIDKGLDVNNWNRNSLITPEDCYLNIAIQKQNTAMIEMLIDSGASLERRFYKDEGLTHPLKEALKLLEGGDSSINREIVQLLESSLARTVVTKKHQQRHRYGDKPGEISRLESLYDIIKAEDRASLFAFIMSNRPEDLPPLFLPDHLITIMDLHQVIASDLFLEDLSEDYQESEDPNKTTDLAIWYQKVIESKTNRQEFFINIRLFDSLSSKQPVARCMEDCIRAYNVTQNPILEVKIEYLIARIAASTHDKNDTLREIEIMLSKQSLAKDPKTVKAKGVIDMATRSARLSANTRRVREIATQAFDSQSHETSAEDLSYALTYYNAYAMDFEFMLYRSNPRNKSHRAIDMKSIDPALILYLENPEILKPIKLARESLSVKNLDDFIADLEEMKPDLLKEFLNKSPIALEDLSNFTTASVIAGPKFIEYLIKKGLDLNSNNRDVSVMPFSSAIMTAIATSQPEVVELILKNGFDKNKPQFLMDIERDPLEYADKALSEATTDRSYNAKLIVKMIKEHYQEKPSPNPKDPRSTTKERNSGTHGR